MDEVRIRDSSINKNIDIYLEELKRDQAAREQQQNADRDRSENHKSGNGAVRVDDRGGAGEEDEEDWEEEYVMLDLHDVFHGPPVPNFAYTLSGLDTLNPVLTLDNELKLVGHYVETVGSVVVYSEKEGAAQTDQRDLPPPAANNENRPGKRIRGVCKLERKLKFCAMPMAYAPARTDVSTGNKSFMKAATPENALLRDDNLMDSTSVERAELREDVPRGTSRLADDALRREDTTPEICEGDGG